MKERFCPPASLPRASKQPTVPFQLTLPTSKDALFHPDTFIDPLWGLGDVVKMLFLVAIRDGVSFHELVRQRASASFGLFPSKGCLSSLFKSGSGEASNRCFTQVFTGQPFRLIRRGEIIGYCHYLPSSSWPPPILSSMCPISAQFIRFRTLDQQRPDQEKGAAQCATQAQKIRLEVQIPAGTAEKDRIVAALVALRRMKIPAESLLPL